MKSVIKHFAGGLFQHFAGGSVLDLVPEIYVNFHET